MGEMYKAWDEIKKEQKQNNNDWILHLLKTNNIQFKIKNYGCHIIVAIDNQRIDVWPTANKAKIGYKYYYNAYELLRDMIKRNKTND